MILVSPLKFAQVADIDVHDFFNGNDTVKLHIAKQVDFSFHEWGIIRLVNHGIPLKKIDFIFNQMHSFFNQNDTHKRKYQLGTFGSPGYLPADAEIVLNSNDDQHDGDSTRVSPDPVETFVVYSNWKQSSELDHQRGVPPYVPHSALLPEQLASFLAEYWSEMRLMLRQWHDIASVALFRDLALTHGNNTFEKNMTRGSLMTIRFSHYVELPERNRGWRYGSHQDYTGFTLLQNDEVGGLQVFNDKRKEWFEVPESKGGVLVFGGEFVQRWTNKHWGSVVHRVRPQRKARQAVVVFTTPDLDEIVDVLPCEMCTKEERVYSPIRGIDNYKKRMKQTSAAQEDGVQSGPLAQSGGEEACE